MEFEIDQFVWISSTDVSLIIKTFLSDANIPFWVGKIEKPSTDTPSKSEKTQHFVRLCGTIYCSWISEENIHHLSDEIFCNAAESNFILKTLVEVIKAGGLMDSTSEPATKDSNKNDESTINCTAFQNSEDVTEVPSTSDEGFPETFPTSVDSCENKHASEKVMYPRETPCKKKLAEDESDPKSSPVRKVFKTFDNCSEQNSVTNQTEVNRASDDPSATPGKYTLFHFPRPGLVSGSNPKKIGFIGEGTMGQIIVKSLLKSGHDVFIWNRSEVNCPKLIENGAQNCSTPSQLVRECDIIFSCLSDRDVKSSFLIDDGILEGLENCEHGTKVYVEMTSIDPSTSRAIAEAVMNHGGKYLEAPICGSERLAEDGFLLIICSGDPELFRSCRSYFEAFCSDLLYLNNNIGNGSKLRLAVSILVGNIYASLLDSMSFLKGCSISRNLFLRILKLIFMSRPFIKVVVESILAEKLLTHISLRNYSRI
ncbi:putative oxidoreductase GLYR1 [Trichonephila inaurata madagascariensis]|uniref:Putative oxidoreductase GLYR1 n=1 Tax=Trichonephila inaurata madagascariensis TaxID=2747483 RepID=A0A8X6MF04_9ARAC|nr:putative oxidoreductase GLYR1 [Trichonephila inaurata madagascariensis]